MRIVSKQFSAPIISARDFLRGQYQKHTWLPLAILGLSSFLIFSVYSIERYFAFQSNFFDLGLDANSIWRTVNGYQSWQSLILPSTPGHINHISPIIGLVALAYLIAPDPRTLLVIQAAVVAFAAVPLYLLAFRETTSRFMSLTLAGLYLANPALHGIIRFDFHPEAFIPLCVFMIYFAYPRQGSITFYLSLGALLSTIEYSAILGLGIAVSLWILNKRVDRRILVTILASLSLLAIIILSTVTQVFQSLNWPTNWLAVQFFGPSSSSVAGYAGSAATFWNNPGILLNALLYDYAAKVTYLIIATAPLWVSVMKYPLRFIPAIPWIAVVGLSSRFAYSNVNFQYSVFLIPFLYVAAIPLMHRLSGQRKLVLALVALALCFTLSFSALTPLDPQHPWPTPSALDPVISSINNNLPQNATILTQTDLFPQLSNRPYVTVNYSSPDPPQYILVNTESIWYNWTSPSLGYPISVNQQLQHFTSEYSYQLTFLDEGIHLYRLDGPGGVS